METIIEALQSLNIGKSVAEFDDALEKYFVETDAFRQLIESKCDIIAGDKGTGKTAIYKILQNKFSTLKELKKIEVIAAFNPSGNPIFQQLVNESALSEIDYIHLWKAYFLSFAGNWILGVYEGNFTENMQNLDRILRGLDLRTEIDAPRNAFSKVINRIGSWFHWKSAELTCTVSESGVPILTPRIEFSEESAQKIESFTIPVDALLRLLDKCIENADITLWIAMDRLDEAFAGHPDIEIPALRALLRTYLDFAEFQNIKLKLFLRKDLFGRITSGGFVNLTHINARKLDITWREADLLNLLCRRVRENPIFCQHLGISDANDDQIFQAIFPPQVDFGKRKPATWTWIMRRIRDGNDIKPPRNLIDLVQLSQNAQIKREEINKRTIDKRPIFEPDALSDGLSDLSNRRVDDTLFAEAGAAAQIIEKFRGGKSEHNLDSISELLNLSPEDAKISIRMLTAAGFLEVIKDSFKVPSLYRQGMRITQGKAFADYHPESDEDD